MPGQASCVTSTLQGPGEDSDDGAMSATPLDLVIAAAKASGDCPDDPAAREAWLGKVRTLSNDFYLLSEQVKADTERIRAAKTFVAKLVDVTVEESSTRGVLHLRTISGDPELPIRTDRGDTPEGKHMIDKAQQLVGHKVVIYKELESGNSRRHRTLVNLVDLGPDDEIALRSE